jgi:hypothetical protein
LKRVEPEANTISFVVEKHLDELLTKAVMLLRGGDGDATGKAARTVVGGRRDVVVVGNIGGDDGVELVDSLEVGLELDTVASVRPTLKEEREKRSVRIGGGKAEERNEPRSDLEPLKDGIVELRAELVLDDALETTSLQKAETERKEPETKLTGERVGAARQP